MFGGDQGTDGYEYSYPLSGYLYVDLPGVPTQAGPSKWRRAFAWAYEEGLLP